MKIRAILFPLAVSFAAFANAANTPPLAESWNIASTGTAATSGELLFRVTPGDGSDATEVTVFVLSGTNDSGVANNIRRAMNSQLRTDRFNVEPGENANVLVKKEDGQPEFSLELIDSDVENVRVMVQSAAPAAPPTVPQQATPATPPQTTPVTPQASGDTAPPAPQTTATPGNASQPAEPPPANSPPLSNPSASPNASGGAPASAPPPG